MTSRDVDDGAGHGTATTPGAKHRDTAIPPPLQSDFDRLKEEVERLSALNATLTDDYNKLLICEARQDDRATQAEKERDEARVIIGTGVLQHASQADARVRAAEATLSEVVGAVALLGEAEIQITYLHEKFGETGSGNAVLARLRAALRLTESPPHDQ